MLFQSLNNFTKKIKLKKQHLPWELQSTVTQVRTSAEEMLAQGFPPCIGDGLVQVRWRNSNPVPQETLHEVQFDQSEKPPSTINKIRK